LSQQFLRNVLQQPDVLEVANMLEILDAELLEDIAANLLVVTCPHLGEGMGGLFIPLLAFG